MYGWIALALTFLLPGCHHSVPSPHEYRGSFEFSSTPEALRLCKFSLLLSDRAGHPVNDAHVVVSLTMTTMFMPPDLVQLHNAGRGKYIGAGIFTMGGPWSATANVTKAGSTSQCDPYTVSVRD